MNNPNDFILNTDFATLKNDSSLIKLSFTVNNGDTVPAGGTRLYQDIVTAGQSGAPLRSRMRDTTAGSTWYSCSQLVFSLSASYPSTPIFEMDSGVVLERINSTQMRIYLLIANGNPGEAMQIRRTETFECELSTFLPPFN